MYVGRLGVRKIGYVDYVCYVVKNLCGKNAIW